MLHPNTIKRIELINKVGLKRLKKYVIQINPKADFDRNVAIARDYIKYGKRCVEDKYDISDGTARAIISRYAKYAEKILESGEKNG